MATTTTYTFANLPKPPGDAHAWTSAYTGFVSKNDPNGYLRWLWDNKRDTVMSQGFQFPASFTNPTATPATGTTTPTATTPAPITPAAGGAGAVPIPAPQDIVMPALDYSGRFGDYHASPYVLGQSYAGPESPPPFAGGTGVPGAAQPPAGAPGTPSPAPAPAPAPGATGGLLGGPPATTPSLLGSSPATQGGSGGNWNGGSGQYSGGLLGGGGSGSSWGSGHTSGTSAPSPSGSSSYGTGDYIDLGRLGASALDMASYIPGNVGLAAGALQLGGQLYNTNVTDNIRRQMGISGLDVGQWVGSGLGFNNYGNLNARNIDIANPDQWHNPLNNEPTGINTGGLYRTGLLGDIGDFFSGDDSAPGRMTLTEAQHRNAYASLPAGFFTPATSTTAPKPSTGTYTPATAPAQATVTGATTLAAPPKYTATVAPSTTSTPSYSSIGLTPIYDRNILSGYKTATGNFVDTATATKQLQSATGSLTGTSSGSATTAAMGGGWNGGYSSGGGIGSGTGITGGGQGERAGFLHGGMIPGHPDGIPDNVPVNADQGEFVVQRQAAKLLGPGLLKSLNDPKKAKKIRGLLRSAA